MTTRDNSRSASGMQSDRLVQRYREQRGDGPTPELDRVVMARAHRALAREPGDVRPRRRWRASPGAWLAGVTTACVGVVALAVVLQQAAPPRGNAGSNRLLDAASPATPSTPMAKSVQSNSTARERRSVEASPEPAGDASAAIGTRRRVPSTAPTEAASERTASAGQLGSAGAEPAGSPEALEPPGAAPLAEEEARPRTRESDFAEAQRVALPPLSADAIQSFVDAGDPPRAIREARRALLTRVRLELARGNDTAARALVENHRSIDPEIELPEALSERLADKHR